MNVRHTLICFFFLSLCGGHSGLVSAKPNMFVGAEGGNGTIYCTLFLPGNTKFFCKNKCEDILIRTDGVRAQSGRYSTEYRNDSSGKGKLFVTITHLIKSDSGLYRCALGENLVQDSYWDFEIRVLDAALLEEHSVFTKAVTEGEDVTYKCTDTVREQQKFLCKGDCKKEEDIIIETDEKKAQNGRYSIEYRTYGLYVTITEATMSDTGQYKCGYGRALSPDLYNTHTILVLGATTTSKPNWTRQPFTTPVPSASTPTTTTHSLSTGTAPFTDVLLYVIVILVIAVIILGLALTITCIQKNKRPDGLRTRGNSESTNMEVFNNRKCPPADNCEDSTYQNFNPATMDEDQTYSALTYT